MFDLDKFELPNRKPNGMLIGSLDIEVWSAREFFG